MAGTVVQKVGDAMNTLSEKFSGAEEHFTSVSQKYRMVLLSRLFSHQTFRQAIDPDAQSLGRRNQALLLLPLSAREQKVQSRIFPRDLKIFPKVC